ncbi:uncharacterized protein LOC125659658 isoform X2 [Ostrea edulis]|uniref:uncharacterized protein LOC125659658 isoform X2 n=1 Tax=Ostrea edulis TaxID=37623 RepID=UPI0024AF050E|nr:uncharacterized protein LOC125659658 isoform X2 [Ostrea edulis]
MYLVNKHLFFLVSCDKMAGIREFQLSQIFILLMQFYQLIYATTSGKVLRKEYSTSGKLVTVNNQPEFTNNTYFIYQMCDRKSYLYNILHTNSRFDHALLKCILLLCGDVSPNPGTVRFPCSTCRKPVKSNQKAIQCDFCELWVHLKCTNLDLAAYMSLGKSDDYFYCNLCESRLPNFTDSFFDDEETTYSQLPSGDGMHENVQFTSTNQSNSPLATPNGKSKVQENEEDDIFVELFSARKANPKKFIVAYLNINSLRSKIEHIHELLTRNIVDILFLSETKLDETFVDAQFQVDNYILWRRDRNAHGRGIVAYLRSDLPELGMDVSPPYLGSWKTGREPWMRIILDIQTLPLCPVSGQPGMGCNPLGAVLLKSRTLCQIKLGILITTLNQFKSFISTWSGPTCKCKSCKS